MATQKCPRCGSDRIRHGYRPTSLFKKLTFRYNLLCDDCNWEFSGFAIPGTVPRRSKKRKDKVSAGELAEVNFAEELPKEEVENKDLLVAKRKEKKRRRKVAVNKPKEVKAP